VAYLEHLEQHAGDDSLIVCAADKNYNLSATLTDFRAIGPPIWQRFTTKNVEDQVWYYGAVHGMLERRVPDMALTKRLGRILLELKDELSVV
jgi:hypothetical protein